MTDTKKHFIATSDEKTAETLRKLGFHELPKEGSCWMFVNEPEKAIFDEEDMKLNYTNMLSI
jgi:hypothetical protein